MSRNLFQQPSRLNRLLDHKSHIRLSGTQPHLSDHYIFKMQFPVRRFNRQFVGTSRFQILQHHLPTAVRPGRAAHFLFSQPYRHFISGVGHSLQDQGRSALQYHVVTVHIGQT